MVQVAGYIVRRIVEGVVVLWLVSLASFALIHLAPGKPVGYALQPGTSPAAAQQQIRHWGLDRPWFTQYADWVKRFLGGDFGHTYNGSIPVAQLVGPALKNSLLLMGTAWSVTWLIAVPWGVCSGLRPYGWADYSATWVGYVGLAMPAFWLGLMLQKTFALDLGWLPLSHMYTDGREGQVLDLVRHMVLPVTTLVLVHLAVYQKHVRASILEVLRQDYVRTARAKGVPERRVLFHHALRNALMPLVTLAGLDLPLLVSGAALTEAVFSWPGMGQLFVRMAFAREYQVLMAIIVIATAVVVAGNLLADLLYAAVDPRVRLTGKGETFP